MNKVAAFLVVFLAVGSIGIAIGAECPDGTKKYVVGLASAKAVDIQVYCMDGKSLINSFKNVQEVPGFENCKLSSLAWKFMSCGEEELYVNATKRVGSCEYHGIHRDGGLGFDKKATWDVWSRAAQECGASMGEINELKKRMNSWAEDDDDPRY